MHDMTQLCPKCSDYTCSRGSALYTAR